MHWHDALRRKQEIEEAEHRLLHLAGISGAADQDDLLLKVDRDHRLAPAAVTRRVRFEARQVDDQIFRLEIRQLVGFGADKQGADEQIVPGQLVDDPDADPVLGLRPAIEVGHEQFVLAAERFEKIVMQPVERFAVHRDIGLAPPDGALGR